MEQLNIDPKLSASGPVAHEALLVDPLSRALAERVMLLDFTIGRKGLLEYLKALGGSSVARITPYVSAEGGHVQGWLLVGSPPEVLFFI
jgi:hypothetical protein